ALGLVQDVELRLLARDALCQQPADFAVFADELGLGRRADRLLPVAAHELDHRTGNRVHLLAEAADELGIGLIAGHGLLDVHVEPDVLGQQVRLEPDLEFLQGGVDAVELAGGDLLAQAGVHGHQLPVVALQAVDEPRVVTDGAPCLGDVRRGRAGSGCGVRLPAEQSFQKAHRSPPYRPEWLYRLPPGRASLQARTPDVGHGLPVPDMAVAPPTCLGARVSRYRCCLPALAGFST